VVTTHYTDREFTAFTEQAVKAGKAYFYGEFNPSEKSNVSDIIQRTIDSNAAGCLAWSLRFRTERGGFYYHGDFNGASDSLHYPGFPSTKPAEEEVVVRLLREGAFAIQGKAIPEEAVPEAPILLAIQSPAAISWQGSSGSHSYNIQRKQKNSGNWKTVGTNISDAIPADHHGEPVAKLPLFSDHPGAGVWHYRVIAKNSSGISKPSNSVEVTTTE